jgi:hypothetical protein
MYFFDLYDYYTPNELNSGNTSWYEYGATDKIVGCGAGPGFFMVDQFGTMRESRNAFDKALHQWFLAVDSKPTAIDAGYITGPLIDSGCTPSFKETYIELQYKIVEWKNSSLELQKTYQLSRYYYDYGVELNWNELTISDQPFSDEGIDPSIWGGTYGEYLDYLVNNTYGDCLTGSTTTVFDIINPYTNAPSGITVTTNYGTSFENHDLEYKVKKYDNAMKEVMCGLKNFMIKVHGDITDALDENGELDFSIFSEYRVF